jgi:hypothetical protein
MMRRIDILRGILGAGWLAVQPACSLAPAPGHAEIPGASPAPVKICGASTSAQPVVVGPEQAQPLYRNPKIGVVYLGAHQDAAGRLLGPQVMYQVIDPGGWNLSAIEQGDAYIPAANLEGAANAAGPPLIPVRDAPADSETTPLLDAKAAAGITITGLMDEGDRAEAEAMAKRAGGALVAVFDRQAGWLLVPPGKP